MFLSLMEALHCNLSVTHCTGGSVTGTLEKCGFFLGKVKLWRNPRKRRRGGNVDVAQNSTEVSLAAAPVLSTPLLLSARRARRLSERTQRRTRARNVARACNLKTKRDRKSEVGFFKFYLYIPNFLKLRRSRLSQSFPEGIHRIPGTTRAQPSTRNGRMKGMQWVGLSSAPFDQRESGLNRSSNRERMAGGGAEGRKDRKAILNPTDHLQGAPTRPR